MTHSLIFRQLFDTQSSTYTYILGCPITREAVIIDPVREQVQRDIGILRDLGLQLVFSIDTHIHADHITGSGALQEVTGAKIVLGTGAKNINPDILLQDGQNLQFGSCTLHAIATPGHTDSCTSFIIDDMVFTGDTLLIGKTGRTDFQHGSAVQLYDSIMYKLYTLPDTTRVFPGHDYNGRTQSTILEEKQQNTRIRYDTLLDDFVSTLKAVRLEYPKNIDTALPANMRLGRGGE